MEQNFNRHSVMETRDHFKNGVNLKSLTNRANSRITKTVSKLGKMAMIVIAAMTIANIANAQTAANKQQSIKTVYPTKDWVVSDFVVTDPKFGAKAEPGFDNRLAFQSAIDAAYNNGGGVVYIPAGNYEFRSYTNSHQKRQGT